MEFKKQYLLENGFETILKLSLKHIKEKEVYILYSPTLDLAGYGYPLKEAKKSFEITLNEFLHYINNKSYFF